MIDQLLLKLATRADPPLDAERKWALALSAMFVEENGGSHDFCAPHSWWLRKHCSDVLHHFWNIEGRTPDIRRLAALKTLHWLRDEGHRAQADQLSQEFFPKDLFAWDHARLVYVARLCLQTQILKEEETWPFIFYAAAHTQPLYTSWSDYAHHFMRGRLWWSGENDQDLQKAVDQLLIRRTSPWVKIAWNTSLHDALAYASGVDSLSI